MSNQWVKQPSLNKAKGSLVGASLYEKIFAIGGGNGVECFSEVEILDLNIGSWIRSQSMLEKVCQSFFRVQFIMHSWLNNNYMHYIIFWTIYKFIR